MMRGTVDNVWVNKINLYDACPIVGQAYFHGSFLDKATRLY